MQLVQIMALKIYVLLNFCFWFKASFLYMLPMKELQNPYYFKKRMFSDYP